MNPIEKAIKEIEQRLREPHYGAYPGLAMALGILLRNLAGTAMVDVKEEDGTECIVAFDSFGLERKCAIIGKDCYGLGNPGCPAHVTEG